MIGKAIKYMRKQKKLNQKELGDLIKINRTTIGNYETGARQPTFQTIEEIANQCGYKIFFESKDEKFQLNDLKRKDI